MIVNSEAPLSCIMLPDFAVDSIVANDKPFSEYKVNVTSGPLYTTLKFDDNTPVTLDDTISVDNVPDDATSLFVLEPAFVQA